MSCENCPWKNPPAIEYEIFESIDNGMVGVEPKRGTENSSGIDVFVPKGFADYHYDILEGHRAEIELEAGEDVLIPLNLRVKIPSGFDIEVKNKSGIATKLKLIKGAQVIDQDYRGNVMIHLFNNGENTVIIKEGMKIAQLVVRPVLINEWKRVDNIDINTERGEGGFGSTGK